MYSSRGLISSPPKSRTKVMILFPRKFPPPTNLAAIFGAQALPECKVFTNRGSFGFQWAFPIVQCLVSTADASRHNPSCDTYDGGELPFVDSPAIKTRTLACLDQLIDISAQDGRRTHDRRIIGFFGVTEASNRAFRYYPGRESSAKLVKGWEEVDGCGGDGALDDVVLKVICKKRLDAGTSVKYRSVANIVRCIVEEKGIEQGKFLNVQGESFQRE